MTFFELAAERYSERYFDTTRSVERKPIEETVTVL